MDRRVELVIAEIETDVARAWETAELAALVNLSVSRFRHLFKEETGRTINQYLESGGWCVRSFCCALRFYRSRRC